MPIVQVAAWLTPVAEPAVLDRPRSSRTPGWRGAGTTRGASH